MATRCATTLAVAVASTKVSHFVVAHTLNVRCSPTVGGPDAARRIRLRANEAAPGVADANARQWAMLAHLSALAGLVIGLNWLGPLIIYLVKKDEHPFIADQSREALNFNISVFIYCIVSAILIIVVVGILLLPVIGIAWVVLTVVATVRANNGEAYRYPLSIRFVSS